MRELSVGLLISAFLCSLVTVVSAQSTADGSGSNAVPPPHTDHVKTGLIFADEASYHSIPLASTPLMGTLPPSVDLTPRFPVPGNQGQQSSCVGWAVAYSLKSYDEFVKRNWSLSEVDHLFSPAFIYNQIKRSPDCNAGTRYIDALNLLRSEGVAPLDQFPYDASSCSAVPDQNVRAIAKQFVVADWRRVNIQDPTEVKTQ